MAYRSADVVSQEILHENAEFRAHATHPSTNMASIALLPKRGCLDRVLPVKREPKKRNQLEVITRVLKQRVGDLNVHSCAPRATRKQNVACQLLIFGEVSPGPVLIRERVFIERRATHPTGSAW